MKNKKQKALYLVINGICLKNTYDLFYNNY